MRVTHLELTNVRAIEAAEFRFRPGFNLVAGINGVGKTTILDALAVCLSKIIEYAEGNRRMVLFAKEDIRMGAGALQIECGFELAGEKKIYTLHMPRETVTVPEEMDQFDRSQRGHLAISIPRAEEIYSNFPVEAEGDPSCGRPLAVLFSTNRAIPSYRTPARATAGGGVNSAYSDALSNRRELRLGEFAAWMRAREELGLEQPAAKSVLIAFEVVVARFLPEYKNLRVKDVGKRKNQLLIDRGDVTLPIQSLSDGERGVLALVLDVTRRLAQANPELDDPAGAAGAVVLIDEIELHLHPSWQRQIVSKLTDTFPHCQFIATTHSPQIIGEVEHDQINIISGGEVHSPRRSYGLDSSSVLEDIMNTDPRNRSVSELLSEISQTISKKKYDEARSLVDELSEHLGESDPEVTRMLTLLEFMSEE